jgi:NAD(P)-dependent dehydrogenase (short-subunit alcohol dehydrogenase family)
MRVLVTGSSRGIGLGICAAYAERGDEVFAVCRQPTPELEALDVHVVPDIELASAAAVATLPDAVGPEPLDVVVCNAAINLSSLGLDDLDAENCLEEIDVNCIGSVRVVLALLPKLQRGSKIMLVSIGDVILNHNVPSGASYGYRMSKAALTSFGFGLARDVRDRGIAVLVAGPGPVDTDMLRAAAARGTTSYDPADAPSPFEVGRQFRDRIDELTLDASPAWQRRPNGEAVVLSSFSA